MDRRILRLELTFFSQRLTPDDLRRITEVEIAHEGVRLLRWHPSAEALDAKVCGTIVGSEPAVPVAPNTWTVAIFVETSLAAASLQQVRLVTFAPDGPVCFAMATLSREAMADADVFAATIESAAVTQRPEI